MVTPSNSLLSLGRRTQLPEIAFRPGDARFLPSCGTQEESCPAAWSVMGDNGIRYKMIRFISGATDSVKTMAVPEFLLDRWPFPDCVTSEGNDPTCLEGAVRRVALVGRAPNITPVQSSALADRMDQRTMTMMMESIVWDGDVVPVRASILKAADTETALMVLGTLIGPNAAFATTVKDPLYGLTRVGPKHDRKGSDASSLTDFLYTGNGLATPDDLMICSVEESESTAQAVGYVRPACRQWFTVPEVNVLVRLTYDRSLLPQWQLLKKNAKERVREFMQLTPSDGESETSMPETSAIMVSQPSP
jgi:hypothetical protein